MEIFVPFRKLLAKTSFIFTLKIVSDVWFFLCFKVILVVRFLIKSWVLNVEMACEWVTVFLKIVLSTRGDFPWRFTWEFFSIIL